MLQKKMPTIPRSLSNIQPNTSFRGSPSVYKTPSALQSRGGGYSYLHPNLDTSRSRSPPNQDTRSHYAVIKKKALPILALNTPSSVANLGKTLALGKKEQKKQKREEVARLQKALDRLMNNLASDTNSSEQ